MIEENPDHKVQSKRKTYAPVAIGWKTFSPAQLKMSIYSKEFLAIYMAFLEFAHILREATKPAIVLTDNKSVTRFFLTKSIPPSLWNPCDYVLQFNFKIAHITGLVNITADYLFRLELKATETIRLTIRDDVQTTHTEVMTSSSDVADAEQFFFTQTNDRDETKKTNPWKGSTISEKGNRMGSTWGTILNEAKDKGSYKDWRMQYVVLHTRNQGKCTDTSRDW